MSLEGDWQIEFICAVRNSIIHTSEMDKMAHGALKTNEMAIAPADAPRGRLRKYLNNLLMGVSRTCEFYSDAGRNTRR